ncbi:MAG TPA: hydroxyisourate hydrolase [Pseudorhizobium sp.]|nr:hydroxyisourate hydrolase [Pseudorhizobium sp.]
MTGLTTHVLDTARGVPAQGLKIDLYRVSGEAREKVKSVSTNADGRVDGGPILADETFKAGEYELVFHAGDYLRMTGHSLPEPAFLDVIPIRFGIADTTAHYHVPLLLSPFGYSTYRGS